MKIWLVTLCISCAFCTNAYANMEEPIDDLRSETVRPSAGLQSEGHILRQKDELTSSTSTAMELEREDLIKSMNSRDEEDQETPILPLVGEDPVSPPGGGVRLIDPQYVNAPDPNPAPLQEESWWGKLWNTLTGWL